MTSVDRTNVGLGCGDTEKHSVPTKGWGRSQNPHRSLHATLVLGPHSETAEGNGAFLCYFAVS